MLNLIFPELVETKYALQTANGDKIYNSKYRLTVCELLGFNDKITYIIELGEELARLSVPLQKRWVRKRAEQEYGSPIKNPTQKRYIWEPYFIETKNINESAEDAIPVWKIVIQTPGA